MYSNISIVRESSQELVQIVKNKINVLFDLNKIQSNINDCNEVTKQIIIRQSSINFVAQKSRFYGPSPPICYALVTLST
jgi:hypothetical protein